MNSVFLRRSAVSLYAQDEKNWIRQNLVGSSGLEPPTSRLSGVRSNHLSYEPINDLVCRFPLTPFYSLSRVGGDERDRTDDPLLAKQVLSQLSYTPIFSFGDMRMIPILSKAPFQDPQN